MQEQVKAKKERVKKKERRTDAVLARRRMHAVLRHVAAGGVAFLLGQAELLFGTHPLGIALLAVSGSYFWGVLCGTVLSAVFVAEDMIVYICTYIAVALIKSVGGLLLEDQDGVALSKRVKKRLTEARQGEKKAEAVEKEHSHSIRAFFSDRLLLAMATAGVGAMIIGLYRVLHGGFRYYDLFATLFMLLLCPMLALLYHVRTERQSEQLPPYVTAVSEACLLFSVVWASRGIELWGISPGASIALFLTLMACIYRGVYPGFVAAVLCGLAYHPLYAPAYLMAALVYFMFMRLGKARMGVLGGGAAALFWFVYLGGIHVLLRGLPSMLVVSMLATFLLQERDIVKKRHEESEVPTEGVRDEDGERMAAYRHKDSKERFRGISDALAGLSEVFYNLSDRFRRPGTLDLRRICDQSMDRFCTDCPSRAICWGLEYGKTLEIVNQLISSLHTKGRVEEGQIPEYFARRCASMPLLLEEINRECARVTYDMLRNNRTEIFAMDYEAAAEIINDALEEDDGEYRFDPTEEQRVIEYLTDAGVRYKSVCVFGKRRRQILVRGAEIDRATVSAETMRQDLGELSGMELGNPIFEVENGISTMVLRAEKRFSVEGAESNLSADGGISGDSLALFSNQKDYFYALINDGMGAGHAAAETSQLCSVFLEKMLRAGNRASTSLRILNNTVRARCADSSDEVSSTVDLLELDLMTGEGAFIKSGAAPSYVVRRDAVHRIQSGTAPIGIIRKLDAQKTSFRLQKGDVVVLISDGILQDDPEGIWLRNYLAGVGNATPEEIVYKICRHASEHEGHDDCSAIALRITEETK